MFFIIGLIMSTSVYGIVCLLFCALGLGISVPQMIPCIISPVGLTEYFYAYMIWSAIAFPFIILLDYICLRIDSHFSMIPTEEAYYKILIRNVGASFACPFRGLVALKGASKVIDSTGVSFIYCWGQVILHFIWSIAIIIWVAINLYILIK